MHPPIIILVRPQMGENIGAAARAMMNFGLKELRLVAPRDGWPNPKAHEMSAHAEHIIEQARVFETLAQALADCQMALAASARRRDMELQYFYYPESIVTAGTTWLGDNFDPVLLYGTLVEVYTFMKGEADLLGVYEAKYKEALALAKRLGDGLERRDAYRSGQTRIEVP